MPATGRTNNSRRRGYSWAYEKVRRQLLAGNPKCHWCGAPATMADHDPPIAEAGYHLNLVPACRRCNCGRIDKVRAKPSRTW